MAPSGLYARLFHAFLVLSFLMISRIQIISGSAGPIFAFFSQNESVLGADDRSGPLFPISQGTLPWHDGNQFCGKITYHPALVAMAIDFGKM